MKLIVYILILAFSLSCSRIKIVDEPVTLIGESPNRINTIVFKSLIDKLGLIEMYDAPDYYGGLRPKYELAQSYSNIDDSECLYYSGGMGGLCENLVVNINGDYKHLKSKTDFKYCFAPIETEKEALSYVSIWSGTIPKYDFDIKIRYRKFVKELNKSFSQKVDSGFITLTYDYEIFGCGPHSHYSVKSFVDFKGNVQEIERIKIYEDPREDGLCVD